MLTSQPKRAGESLKNCVHLGFVPFRVQLLSLAYPSWQPPIESIFSWDFITNQLICSCDKTMKHLLKAPEKDDREKQAATVSLAAGLA